MAPILPVEQALLERARWLIRLRWIAALGAVLTLLFSKAALHLPLDPLPLALCLAWVVAYNSFFSYTQRGRILQYSPQQPLYRFISLSFNVQIALDWITLVAMLHFSGGLENPFIMYFIFHGILAGMLLSRRASYIHATLALVLVAIMGIGEGMKWLPHVATGAFMGFAFYDKPVYVGAVLFAFVTTMYLVVYLTTEISSVLRRRELELAELEESLRHANEALMEKDRIRSEYVLRVSHDLASPLAATHSMLSLVLQTMSADLSERAKDFLTRSLRRVDALLRLARGLFDLSRIRASQTLAIEPLDVASVARSALEDVLTRQGEKDIVVNLDIPESVPFLLGDKEHIELAFKHLLMNATQYAPPGVRITMRVRAADGWIEVSVEDTGVGIPAAEIPRLYDEFYRGSMAKELEPNGWGLGLTIVKQIVDRHGGVITVDSEPGKGSRFTLRFPSIQNQR